jgi:L-seryl-tRNA(Ser) seleniumtransferase
MSKPTESNYLRALPAVDRLVHAPALADLLTVLGTERLTSLARTVIDELRNEVQDALINRPPTAESFTSEQLITSAIQKLREAHERDSHSGIRRVINATGVIVHTNLGRAPLSRAAIRAVAIEADGYCTLEFDTSTGARGRRGNRAEALLKELTNAEDALIVNNCAAAALLVLKVLASDGDTLVSRGELVEIGGDFRVPDVMANSGTKMVEVGSTNRTRIDDYERALSDKTRLVMRVHPSNYRIVGFTSAPSLTELAMFAHKAKLPLYEDAGSGVLVNLENYGLGDEPVIKDSIAAGADVVTFSGDKLLGATQAGVIVGRATIIGRLRKHSLYRALRADKLTLAALEATLVAHLRGTAFAEVPTLRMLAMSANSIGERAKQFIEKVTQSAPASGLRATLVPGESVVGGGSGPNTHPPTNLVALEHNDLTASEIEARLRSWLPPVISRVAESKVLLDLRTVSDEDEPALVDAVVSLA